MMDFDELKIEYANERKVSISDDQFSVILTLYPSLLVAMADDVLDRSEKEFLRDVAVGSALNLNHEDTEQLAEMILDDLLFLATNIDRWKMDFLTVLKKSISSEDLDLIESNMKETASSHKGTSDDEQKVITEVMKVLSN